MFSTVLMPIDVNGGALQKPPGADAVTSANDPMLATTEASLEWQDLAVLAAWLAGATLFAVRRFRWEPRA